MTPQFVYWFVMLMPIQGSGDLPKYTKFKYTDPVSCHMKLDELKETEAQNKFQCKMFKSHFKLD